MEISIEIEALWMNIVLIGFRGTGKTSVGKRLSEKLNKKLVVIDDLVVKKARLTILEIVENYGWDKFRDIETEVTEEVGKMNDCVIDTGGGIVLRAKNVKNLKRQGVLVLLKADKNIIINRIKHDKGRPPLTPVKSFTEEVGEVLEGRRKKYEKAADIVIDTSKLTIDEIADRVVSYIKQIESVK